MYVCMKVKELRSVGELRAGECLWFSRVLSFSRFLGGLIRCWKAKGWVLRVV